MRGLTSCTDVPKLRIARFVSFVTYVYASVRVEKFHLPALQL